jgi:hypothetical protein
VCSTLHFLWVLPSVSPIRLNNPLRNPIRVLINFFEITDDFLKIYKSGCNVRVDNEGDVGKAW